MQPSQVYEQMLEELQSEINEFERRVFEALRKHPHGLTRPQLVAIVYRERQADITSNNDRKDRKVRKAIQSLREQGVPIISSSGRAGYRLDASPEGKAAMLSDLTSRRDRLNTLITRVGRFETVSEIHPQHPQQSNLFS